MGTYIDKYFVLVWRANMSLFVFCFSLSSVKRRLNQNKQNAYDIWAYVHFKSTTSLLSLPCFACISRLFDFVQPTSSSDLVISSFRSDECRMDSFILSVWFFT
ncbi:unnamed protein product [Ixodes pacificus]